MLVDVGVGCNDHALFPIGAGIPSPSREKCDSDKGPVIIQ